MKNKFILTLLTIFITIVLSKSLLAQETETQFSNWLKHYIPNNYQNSAYDHHNDWFQVFIPKQKLTLSWGAVTSTQLELKEVEGLTENKSIFIAKKSKEDWLNLPNVKYYPGIGYYISRYKASIMGSFKVRSVTIIQFDGKSKKFVDQMVSAYTKKPNKSEYEFMYWVKQYVNTEYPTLKVDYHGAWYQSVVPELNLTVTWGTMDKSQMKLKELHGVREDKEKSFFIENKVDEGWEEVSKVNRKDEVGYYISEYSTLSMGNFEVGDLCVVQFNGDAKVFVDKMTKEWAKVSKNKKFRVIMTSDFPPIGVVKDGNVPNMQKSDPDDMQSMVRFLLYANEFDIEGLVASAGSFAMVAKKKNILGVLNEYEKVYENLKTYDPEYPTADYLRSVTYEGKGNNNGVEVKFGYGKQPYTDIIGKGMDSEASNAIIAAADKPDPRPLWIGVWGGPREVAQAIWDVKNTRSEEELKVFISKLRIFLIYYQDATHGWLMDEFPELFIIESRKSYKGMFGGDDPISDLAWINKNIRFNHGSLCDIYPREGMGCTGVCEGDSPTFMYLISANRGINDPEDPTQPSWGGQYIHKENTNHYVDGPGSSTIAKWRNDYQKEFLELADRCIQPNKVKIASQKNLAFMQWLYEYIPSQYPNAKMTDHIQWLQAHIGDELVVNWAQINDEGADLKYLEEHNLTQGKNIFIEKSVKLDWTSHPSVTYFKRAGYYISGYDSATMGKWEIEKSNVIQFDGDGEKFAKKISKAWVETQ